MYDVIENKWRLKIVPCSCGNYDIRNSAGTLRWTSSVRPWGPVLNIKSGGYRTYEDAVCAMLSVYIDPDAPTVVRCYRREYDRYTLDRYRIMSDGSIICVYTTESGLPPCASVTYDTEQGIKDSGKFVLCEDRDYVPVPTVVQCYRHAARIRVMSDGSVEWVNADGTVGGKSAYDAAWWKRQGWVECEDTNYVPLSTLDVRDEDVSRIYKDIAEYIDDPQRSRP